MKESDYGFDLLGVIVGQQTKKVDFTNFIVADALEDIKADTLGEIRRVNYGCSATNLVLYFSKNFPHTSRMRRF